MAEPLTAPAPTVTLPGRPVRVTAFGAEVAFGALRPVWIPAGILRDLGPSDVLAGIHVYLLPEAWARERGIG